MRHCQPRTRDAHAVSRRTGSTANADSVGLALGAAELRCHALVSISAATKRQRCSHVSIDTRAVRYSTLHGHWCRARWHCKTTITGYCKLRIILRTVTALQRTSLRYCRLRIILTVTALQCKTTITELTEGRNLGPIRGVGLYGAASCWSVGASSQDPNPEGVLFAQGRRGEGDLLHPRSVLFAPGLTTPTLAPPNLF